MRIKSKRKAEENEFTIPKDVDNEQLILGLALNYSKLVNSIKLYTKSEYFLYANHRCICHVMLDLHSRNIEITPDTIIANIHKYDGSNDGVTLKYLNSLRSSFTEEHSSKAFKTFIDKLNKDYHKKVVREEHLSKLKNVLSDPTSSIEDVKSKLESINRSVASYDDLMDDGFRSLGDINKKYKDELIRRAEGTAFVSTGFKDLDLQLSMGFARKCISIAAGRPGMAKSALVANFMYRMGKKGTPNALVALEMNSISMYDRLLAIDSGVELERLLKYYKSLDEEEKRAISESMDRLEKLPIYIDDTPAQDLMKLESRLRSLIEEKSVRIVFIDLYMKLKKPGYVRNKSTADIYTEMLNATQLMAKELDIHICIVVQIGRRAESRVGNKRPILSDLKDSGAYEEIADLVMLLYRERYYEREGSDENDKSNRFKKEKNTKKDVLEVHIAKQRQGEQNAVVKLEFIGETTKIVRLRED